MQIKLKFRDKNEALKQSRAPHTGAATSSQASSSSPRKSPALYKLKSRVIESTTTEEGVSAVVREGESHQSTQSSYRRLSILLVGPDADMLNVT